MDQLNGGAIPWVDNQQAFVYHRKVVPIDTEHCRQLTLNAPIATANEQRYGGGSVKLVKAWTNSMMSNIGIENLLVKREYEHDTGTNHATGLVYAELLRDSRIRNVTLLHLSKFAVQFSKDVMHISVIDVKYLDPKGPGAAQSWGYRFVFENRGQLNLFLRCESQNARYASVPYQYYSHGPNAFVNCIATGTLLYSVRILPRYSSDVDCVNSSGEMG